MLCGFTTQKRHTHTQKCRCFVSHSQKAKRYSIKKHKISQQPANIHIREAATMKCIDLCLENDLKDNKRIVISGWIKNFFHYNNLTWPPHSHSAAAFRLCWQYDKNVLQQTDDRESHLWFTFIPEWKAKSIYPPLMAEHIDLTALILKYFKWHSAWGN